MLVALLVADALLGGSLLGRDFLDRLGLHDQALLAEVLAHHARDVLRGDASRAIDVPLKLSGIAEVVVVDLKPLRAAAEAAELLEAVKDAGLVGVERALHFGGGRRALF